MQGMTHAMAQGVLSLVQGQDFVSAFTAGLFGSYGASAFSTVAGKFASSAVGVIASGAVLGGVGSELTGGNFWQGAAIGGFVAAFNHTFHTMDFPFDDGDGDGGKKGDSARDSRHHKPAPKDLEGFPDAKRVPNKGRARWKNPNGKILEWDKQHGDVEVYNKKGKHQGSARPETGEIYKPPVPGRKIDPIIKVGVGVGIIYSGLKILDWSVSKFTPILMTPIMMYDINTQSTYQNQKLEL